MKVEPYNLDQKFETALGVVCASSPKFWGSIGHAVEVDALSNPAVKFIFQAVRAIAKDLGHGPSGPSITLQRLKRWMQEGKLNQDDIDSVIDLIAEADTPPIERDVIAELAPIIQRRMQQTAVRTAMDQYAKRGDFEEVSKIIHAARTLGKRDITTGTRLGSASFAEIQRARQLDRLPLGVLELDAGLNGGLPRGCLGVYVGGSGGGKSMFLSHSSAYAMREGLFVLYATLELSEATVLARVKSNLTGVSINELMEGDHDTAKKLIEDMYPTLGSFIVKDFPAKATSMPDIRSWVKACEDDEGYEADLVVIDYGDKLRSHDRNDKSSYDTGNTVFEDMRLFMHETGKWGLTGSQSTRKAGKEKNRRIELDDVADSMGKIRTADLVVTINPDNTGDQLSYFVAKFRHGKSQFTVGPIPHEWENGRMIPHIGEP